jgi:probable DNA repair protein
LFKALESGALMLVANKRLAASWRDAYDDWQADRGRQVWPDAEILPLFSWLSRLWLHHGDGQVAATDMEESGWWRKAIREDARLSGIVHIRSLAEEAMDASRMLHAYGYGRSGQRGEADEHFEMLLEWRDRVDAWLLGQGKLTQGCLWEKIIGGFESGSLPVPPQVFLAGFVEEPPAMHSLIEVLIRKGCRIERISTLSPAARRKLWRLTDAESEARFLAGRIREVYRPGMSIGVVVPGLGERQVSLAGILEEELNPQGRMSPCQPVADFSLGRPLSCHPLIRSAMLLLSWAGEDSADFSLLSAMLRIPQGCGHGMERLALEMAARKKGGRNLPVFNWLNWSECSGRSGVCNWLKQVHGFGGKTRLPPSAWIGELENWLSACGWPGEMAEDITPVLREWRETLASLKVLDAPLGRISWRAFRSELFSVLERHIFRPDPGPGAIHVGGLLESVGQSFDHLFIIGIHEGAWPQSPRPNALIPVEMQCRLGLPHADAEREYRYAAAVWKQLLATSPVIEVMYAVYDFREGERNPSPLVMDWEVSSIAQIKSLRPSLSLAGRGAASEWIANPRIPLTGSCMVSGGSSVLQYQSDCPFKAFAACRLGLEGMGEPPAGVDAMSRGSIVHAALSTFWGEVRSKQRLTELVASRDLDAVVCRHVERAVARYAPFWLDRDRKKLESRVVCELLLNWLQVELRRLAFVVRACEKKKEINIGGLGLRIQLDRVDEDEERRHIILDYKTGAVSASKWQGERPEDPQLPLYALSESADAVAFAQIRSDGFRFTGLAKDADILPGVKVESDWEGQLQVWKDTLEALAREFIAGDTRAFPRGKDACRHCDFATFCRISEEEPRA